MRKALIVLINLAVIALIVNVLYIPLLSPAIGERITDRRPEFVWGGYEGGYLLLVDQDPSFDSPLENEVSGNAYRPDEPMEFDTYYWKVVSENGRSSPTGMFTIVSEVSVERGSGWLKNSGNTDIRVERQGITGFLLGINRNATIGGNESVTALQA